MIIEHAKRGKIQGTIVGEYTHLGNEFVQVELTEAMHGTGTAMTYQQAAPCTWRKGIVYDIAKVYIESIA